MPSIFLHLQGLLLIALVPTALLLDVPLIHFGGLKVQPECEQVDYLNGECGEQHWQVESVVQLA